MTLNALSFLQNQGAFTGGQILFNELFMCDRDRYLGARECFLSVRGKCEREGFLRARVQAFTESESVL